MTTATPERYHHGDLPNALRRAAVEVIDERGVGGFSLREVARRAGVSHTAPAHHFGDTKGLFTSLAQEGFERLQAVCEAAAAEHDRPFDQLVAIGQAYVALGSTNHAHLEVMFRTDIVDTDDAGLMHCGLEAYGVLERTVRALVESERLATDVDDAAWLCWSAMQGLVTLSPKFARISALHGGDASPVDELVLRFTRLMVDGIRGAMPHDPVPTTTR
ncbi:MAG: TetR/AcrR family transcriptional regulator [Ilumatobacteraceae bacterium]